MSKYPCSKLFLYKRTRVLAVKRTQVSKVKVLVEFHLLMGKVFYFHFINYEKEYEER